MSGCCEKNNRWLWEDGSQPIAILDRKLGHKYHYVRGTLTGRRLTTLRSISRQPTDKRHVSTVSPDWLRPDLSERIQDSALIIPVGSVAFLEGGRGGGKDRRQSRPPRTGANPPPSPSHGWLWGVDSDRSQRPVMQDGCETTVPPGSCRTTPATPRTCPHHAFVARASCTGQMCVVGGRHEPSSLSSCL